MSQKCKGLRQFRGILNVTQDSKIKVNNPYIPEGTTNTTMAQKANYKAYAIPTVKYTKEKKEKPSKIQQTSKITLFIRRCISNSKYFQYHLYLCHDKILSSKSEIIVET